MPILHVTCKQKLYASLFLKESDPFSRFMKRRSIRMSHDKA